MAGVAVEIWVSSAGGHGKSDFFRISGCRRQPRTGADMLGRSLSEKKSLVPKKLRITNFLTAANNHLPEALGRKDSFRLSDSEEYY